MQTTSYHLLGSKDGTHYVEFTPRPRSRKKAIEMFESLHEDYVHARVEKHVNRRSQGPQTMRSDLIEVEVELKHETAAAILVSDGDQEVWIPKSQCEFTEPGKSRIITVTLPERVALEKKLI